MEILIQNKKAKMNYEILEKYNAGMELFGFEVKSLRQKIGSLDGTHITVRGGEVFLIGAQIPPYQLKNTPKNYDSRRNRRLLLTKKEIKELSDIESKRGLTIVPTIVYNSGKNIKIEIASVRGKKKYDKREDIKKRDTNRDIQRTLKGE